MYVIQYGKNRIFFVGDYKTLIQKLLTGWMLIDFVTSFKLLVF